MKIMLSILFLFVYKTCSKFTNDFVVELDKRDDTYANQLAQQHGFINMGHLFQGHYHFIHQKVHRRSVDSSPEVHLSLENDHRVSAVDQQFAKKRTKRDYDDDLRPLKDLDVEQEIVFDERLGFSDPLYHDMWYIDPQTRSTNGALRNKPGDEDIRHMNIVGAWKLGYTGKGIVVTILDDGIEMTHPDLNDSYDANASWDVNGNDNDPTPHYNQYNKDIDFQDSSFYSKMAGPVKLTEDIKDYRKEINRHGTRCAGEVAARAGNTACVPGIAYNAKVGGVRMLDGDVTDLVEARSIGLRPEYIDIYSASWGPDDDGKTVDGPAKLAIKAFKYGATAGRRGLGSIFVWASGNGGRYQDYCNCDGYTNSIYTISISSTSEEETIPWYSEACASTLASTYSSGSTNEKMVVTTDLNHICTKKHTGTSASAPIAAAIIALALEANKNLGWRDMQHIIVRTARKRKLKAPGDWSVNAKGRDFSHRYGYGLMDAGAMVKLAAKWRNVPQQRNCTIKIVKTQSPKLMTAGNDAKNPLVIPFTYSHDECQNREIDRIEHVLIKLTMEFRQYRGDLEILLVSPKETESKLLAKRPNDHNADGFNKFQFLSVHMWDESPEGEWKIKFINTGTKGNNNGKVTLLEATLHGTGNEQYIREDCAAKGLLEMTITGECVVECPRGTYKEESNMSSGEESVAISKCSPCVERCIECVGPAGFECSKFVQSHVQSRDESNPMWNKNSDGYKSQNEGQEFQTGSDGKEIPKLHSSFLSLIAVLIVGCAVTFGLLKLVVIHRKKSKRLSSRTRSLPINTNITENDESLKTLLR